MKQADEVLIVGYANGAGIAWFDSSTAGREPYRAIILCVGDVYTDGRGRVWRVVRRSPMLAVDDVTREYLEWASDFNEAAQAVDNQPYRKFRAIGRVRVSRYHIHTIYVDDGTYDI